MNAIIQWFDDPRLIRLGLTLVHFLWQGALLGVAAAILMTWMRRVSSRRRYAVLLTAFVGMAITPVVTILMLPSPRKPIEPMSAAMPTLLPAHDVVSKALAATANPIAPPAASDRPLDHGAETPATAAPVIGFPARISLAWAWIAGHPSWFVAAWATGVCLFSVRLMIGLGGASRVRRIGVKPVPADCQACSAELATILGIRRPINLAQSALVKVPVVVGWLRPIVLLPASVITGLPEPELRAILAHELAHIRRHDYLVNTLQTIVETLLFYHPAVWWLSNAILQEREQCCDELAADACGDRMVVAKALVRLAEVRAVAGSAALAATDGRLSRRVRRLLTGPCDSKRPARWQPLAGAGIAILLTAGILMSVNTLNDAFAESQANAQEPTSKTNDIQDASQAKSDGKTSKDSERSAEDVDPLKQQLRRLEQQNEETRRELLRLEEQLRAEREKAPVPSGAHYVKRATDADSRQARFFQLRKQEAEELTKLAGTWQIIATNNSRNDPSKIGSWMTWEFRGHDVTIDQKIGQENEGVRNDHHSWTYHINPTKVPKEMTIYGTDMLMQAIYQLDGNTLKICFFGRSEHDRPTSFEPTKDDVPLVWTFLRVKSESK